MKPKLNLSHEIWMELNVKQQADLQARYEVTVAKRAYSNGSI